MNDAIRRTLADIATFLRDEKIPFAVIGGIAVTVRGDPRFTAAVDVVVGIEVDRGIELLDATAASSFRALLPDAEEILTSAYILPLRHVETGIRVDVAIGLSGFERDMIERAEEIAFEGVSVPVASAEDLLLMKVLAGRPRDLEDAKGIASRCEPTLDWDSILRVGGQLQEATDQDLLAALRRFRAGSGG